MVNTNIITKSAEETRNLGKKFAQNIQKGGIVALYGDLGAGKTTFIQGVAEGLGIKQRIISPTFIIVRTYRIANCELRIANYELRITNQESRIKNFYHIDLYRIKDQKDIEGLGIQEILSESQNVVIIEWSEKMGSLLPKKRWNIRFEYIDENTRNISMSYE